jgi:NAD(P)-dependent dehydrogenase (short-subunit alcohol dehydrogenase family)
MGRMEGKVAIVTGAAQGIGRGVAVRLAQEGARVVAGDIQDDKGQSVVAAIRASGHEAAYCHVDVVSEEQCASLVEAAVSRFGRLDVLVNNAGRMPRGTLEETTTDLWEQVLQIDLRGAFYCCKYAVPRMRQSGGGSIVNIGSIAGIQGLPNMVAYASAKGGLLALTRTLAGAYIRDRIRVNYVIPGWILTEGELALQHGNGVTDEALQAVAATMPTGRHQTVDDAANAVIYLASDDSAQVTGTILHLDAGASELPVQPTASYTA